MTGKHARFHPPKFVVHFDNWIKNRQQVFYINRYLRSLRSGLSRNRLGTIVEKDNSLKHGIGSPPLGTNPRL